MTATAPPHSGFMTPGEAARYERSIVGDNVTEFHRFDFYPDTQPQAHQIANSVATGRDAEARIGRFLDGTEQFFHVRCVVRISGSTWMAVTTLCTSLPRRLGVARPTAVKSTESYAA